MRQWVDKGLSERRALSVMRMSASALRYEPRPDRNVELRERILALAQRHKRYGVGIRSKLSGLRLPVEASWFWRRIPSLSRIGAERFRA